MLLQMQDDNNIVLIFFYLNRPNMDRQYLFKNKYLDTTINNHMRFIVWVVGNPLNNYEQKRKNT